MRFEKFEKIVFVYEDEIHYLEGKEAQKWLEACNGAVMMNYIHGQPFPSFNWIIEKKGGIGRLWQKLTLFLRKRKLF